MKFIKKLLLTAFVGLVGFTSFSNAGDVVLTSSDGENMDQSSITVIGSNVNLQESDITNFICEKTDCYLDIDGFNCSIFGNSNGIDIFGCNFNAGNYEIACEEDACFSSITISHDGLLGNVQNSGNSGNSSSLILSGGINNLTPIVTILKSVVNEFIPYVIYLGIGLLIAVLGFKAIKWLVNWLGIRVSSVFSSKRRK